VLGIDTNVLVRYLVRDDQQQFERVRRLINRELGKGEPVLVSLLVLLETEWVLRSRYSLGKTQMLLTLSALLEASDLVLEDEPAVEHAIYSWKESAANFSDCVINARNRRIGCSATATFDRNALKVDGFMAA